MILTCECGGEMSLVEEKFSQSDIKEFINNFAEKHLPCREAYVLKMQVEARRASMLKIESSDLVNLEPGEILSVLDAPDYTEALNKIAEHLSNIEMNTRTYRMGGKR